MLKDLLLKNNVIYAHIQRLTTIDGVEKCKENFEFKHPKPRYYNTDRGEWVEYISEDEDGELSFETPTLGVCLTDFKDPYSFGIPLKDCNVGGFTIPTVKGWVYAHDVKMLLIRMLDKSANPVSLVDSVKEVYTEIMLFFEENSYYKNYCKEVEDDKKQNPADWNDNKEIMKLLREEDEIEDNMPLEELVQRHEKLADGYERIKAWEYAAKHFYAAYIYSGQTNNGYSQNMLIKASLMMNKMKEEGNQEGIDAALAYFKASETAKSKFKFDTEKEESSVGDVVMGDKAHKGPGTSTSEKPNVGKIKATSARTLTNYTFDTLMSMAANTHDCITNQQNWLESLKRDRFNTMCWQNIYKPGAIKLQIETEWSPVCKDDDLSKKTY